MTDPTPQPTPSQPRWMIPLIVSAIAVVVLGIGGTVYYFFSRDLTAAGAVQIVGSDHWSGGNIGGTGSCSGAGGYDDIRPGGQVVITDDSGKTVGIGSLGLGSHNSSVCTLEFKVSVPRGSKFYGVAVGHRNVVQFAAADLGHIELSIGS